MNCEWWVGTHPTEAGVVTECHDGEAFGGDLVDDFFAGLKAV